MNSEMENAGFELQKIVTGQEKKVPRWKKCTHAAMNALPDDVGKLFIDHFFDSRTKEAAQHMVTQTPQTLETTAAKPAKPENIFHTAYQAPSKPEP